MSGWFELAKRNDGQFQFVLKANNGEPVLTSEQYKAKGSAEAGISSVQVNCRIDARCEYKTSKNGKPYFKLKASNGQLIGTGEMYAPTSVLSS